MAPLYRDGDVLIVSPTASVRKGDRVVVRTERRGVGEGAQAPHRQGLELRTLGRETADRTIPSEEVAWIARVMWARQ